MKNNLRRILCIVLAFSLLFSLTACGKRDGEDSSGTSESQSEDINPEFPVTIGNSIINEKPLKVVSLSPALTEIMAAMNFDDLLVGVSDYCDYPQSVATLPACGTPTALNFEKIFSLAPQLIVTSAPLTEEDLIKLQQKNIEVLLLQRAANLDALAQLYTDLATALEGNVTGKERGKSFFADLSAPLAEYEALGKDYAAKNGKKPTVIMLRMADFTMATGDTLENRLLEGMGLTNLASAYGDWTFPTEDVKKLTPDVIIAHSAITIPILEKNATYKGTTAVIKDQVVNVDFTAFERQSPRMFTELKKIVDFIYKPQGASSSSSSSATA